MKDDGKCWFHSVFKNNIRLRLTEGKLACIDLGKVMHKNRG